MSAVRGMRWRAALLVAGALVVVLWRVTAGGPTTIIQIEFGMYPEEFVGATVVIDGEDRGQLVRRGARTVNGFEVPEGDHTIQVSLPDVDGEVRTVTTGFGATTVRLMLDFADVRRDGEIRTMIVFQ